ncbi:hypothetical protein RUM44_001501 [Polyplax serrata]|uniref:Uncharacterized protein n=1 Tax=Polyplax serrata TaxID=468196 RepID=A0ABR1AKG4_POLSC
MEPVDVWHNGGAQGVLPTPFSGMHGLTGPLAFAGSPVTSGMPLPGFALPGANAALGVPGIRLPGSGGCVLLVSNLNQEATFHRARGDGLEGHNNLRSLELSATAAVFRGRSVEEGLAQGDQCSTNFRRICEYYLMKFRGDLLHSFFCREKQGCLFTLWEVET